MDKNTSIEYILPQTLLDMKPEETYKYPLETVNVIYDAYTNKIKFVLDYRREND